MEIQLKINGWDKITKKIQNELVKISEQVESGEISPTEGDVKMLALLTGRSEEEISSLKYSEFEALKKQTMWLLEKPKFKDVKKIKHYKLGDKEFEVSTDLSDFTYSQFADYQTYITKDDNETLLLTTILVPKGCVYGRGYSVDELMDFIEENMPLCDFNAVLAFFFRKLKKSYKRSLYYFASVLLMKGKWKELKKVIETARML